MAKKIIKSDYLLQANEYEKHFKIFAGPGAGKTYFLINNIKSILKNCPKVHFNNRRKILCITYTNAAVDVIENRLGILTENVYVSTIHKFIIDHIVKPYQKYIKEQIKSDFDINIDNKTILKSQVEGFGVLRGIKKEDAIEYLNKSINTDNIVEYSKAAFSSVELDIQEYSKNNELYFKSTKKVLEAHKKIIKKFIWNIAGVLTHDEILYFGYAAIKNNPIIKHILRLQFPFVFIDEFQDTSPLQTKILKLIGEKESVIGIIGDRAQSIYSFQGANPTDFVHFNIGETNIQEYVINGNRRSNQKIIHFINYIRQKDTKLSAQKCLKKNSTDNNITIFLDRGSRSEIERLNYLIDKETFILTRRWADQIHYITEIEDGQKKLIQDLYNIFRYQRDSDIRKEINDFDRINWIKSLKTVVNLELAKKDKCLANAIKSLNYIFEMNKILKEKDFNNTIFFYFIKFFYDNFDDLNEERTLIKTFQYINTKIESAGKNLEVKELLQYPSVEDDEKIYEILNQLTYKTGKKMILEFFNENGRYMTIHQAKGQEFDKVLINITPAKDDDADPTDLFKSPDVTTNEVFSEFSRIFYVGCSRAINKLYIHLNTKCKETEILENIEKWRIKNNIETNFVDVVDLSLII